MDIKKYNKIRDMYKPVKNSPLAETDRTSLDANAWSDPTTNIKTPTTKPVKKGFDHLFSEMAGLGKRVNEAGGWKEYWQSKKGNNEDVVALDEEETAVEKYEGTLEEDNVVEKTDAEIEAYKEENETEHADGEIEETTLGNEVKIKG
tara:strand:- start:1132 stop:1572 length:441 start_codon:yes stop_codon:yes gene_type:complete